MPYEHPDKIVILSVYDPPKPDLPYLAVAIYPDGKVVGLAAPTASDAQGVINELAAGVGTPVPEEK